MAMMFAVIQKNNRKMVVIGGAEKHKRNETKRDTENRKVKA